MTVAVFIWWCDLVAIHVNKQSAVAEIEKCFEASRVTRVVA